jgi:RNA-directed DNA polymerase
MKRIGNLYELIISMDNLRKADELARKGKKKSYGVRVHDKNRDDNILKLHESLKNKTFKTSDYHIFKIFEPKEREIYRLPYFPDRIVHHAVMNVLEPIWMSIFTDDTYSCIKGKGIHAAVKKLKRDLKDTDGTRYCLKLDIKKFYPSIDHDILKTIVRRKIKDNDLLWLLDEIIDSAPGVPIGNYLSQYFANLYLAYFDHYIKEDLRVKYYYRYADDIVILSNNKEDLHYLLNTIKNYFNDHLNIEVKRNYQVFPIDARGIDFLGYRFYHTHTLLRKSIKKRFARAVSRKKGDLRQVHAAYWGWAKHCNSTNLLKKLTS